MTQYFNGSPSHTHIHPESLSQSFYRAAAPQLPLHLPEAYEQTRRQAVGPSLSPPILARSVPEQDVCEFVGESRALHRPCQPTPEPDPLTVGHTERAGESAGVQHRHPQRFGELVRVYRAAQVGYAFAFLEYFQHLPRLNPAAGICVQFLAILGFFTQGVEGSRLALLGTVWVGAPGREDKLSVFGEIVVITQDRHELTLIRPVLD